MNLRHVVAVGLLLITCAWPRAGVTQSAASGQSPGRAARAATPATGRRTFARSPRRPLQERHRLFRACRSRHRRSDAGDRSDERAAGRRPEVADDDRFERRPDHRHHLQHGGAAGAAALDASAVARRVGVSGRALRCAARRARRGGVERRGPRRACAEPRESRPDARRWRRRRRSTRSSSCRRAATCGRSSCRRAFPCG